MNLSRQKLWSLTESLEVLGSGVSDAARTALAEWPESRTAPLTVYGNNKAMLCVGGRSGSGANYRDVVESVGGRSAHLDDGREDHSNIFDLSLAAAGFVICQTGCIIHNASWRVIDFCKRNGKSCVFVENPSASCLGCGLEPRFDKDIDAAQAPSCPRRSLA